ncbi:MAG: hypothetical protein KAX20_05185, partial [Candidatus Omnitrophica bacterium]|nr:hypothetical protein [Candidatus Omnitrophota bacterium]
MTPRENWLRAVEFRNPEWIPCNEISFSRATWHKYREELEKLIIHHPLVFGQYQKGSTNFDSFPGAHRKGRYYRDPWGCLWTTVQDGLEGQVIEHPLANWDAFTLYRLPDPLIETEGGGCTIRYEWNKIKKEIRENRREG